jgi:hypothetical protein
MPRHPPCALLRLISNSIYWRTPCLHSLLAQWRAPFVAADPRCGLPHGVDSSHPVCRCRQTNHPSIDCQRAGPIPTFPLCVRAVRDRPKRSECELEMRECGRLPRLFRRRPEGRRLLEISRKEVIQPQVPLRLPCYDFAPVTELTFDGCLLAVSPPASGPPSFHGVTGGVYKARERIHRGVADPRLLAIPASCSRVADCNPNLDRLLAIGAPSRVGDALYRPL